MTAVDLAVVVPVHSGVRAAHLREAMGSVASQTVVPRQVIVVLDGPVSAEHERALTLVPSATVVRLPHSLGSGPARRRALEACTTTWVGLVDSDDVSEPHRLERQLQVLHASGADVCAAAMSEFRTGSEPSAVRRTPLDHTDFARLMGFRNPVNQPAVVFRRAAYLEAGGYDDLPFLEDYDLWARMLSRGARFVGVAEPLVRFRVDGMLARRTSEAARRSEREMQRRLRSCGLIGPAGHLRNRVVRGLYLRLPAPLLQAGYRAVFN